MGSAGRRIPSFPAHGVHLIAASEEAEASPLLDVTDLSTYFDAGDVPLKAVDRVTFHVGRGERVAMVGESGSGKSVTAMSIAGLIDPPGHVVGGSVTLAGSILTGLNERALSKIRGSRIGYVFQDAQGALNPVRTIGSQLVETLRLHHEGSRSELRARAAALLEQVDLGNVELRLNQYPHELSGGMNQRVMIAMALAGDPELLIADEPTTALDATTEVAILALINELAKAHDLGVLMISHDLGAVSGFADRVLIMYAGRIVEEGLVEDVFLRPRHPYTVGLLASVPGRRTRGLMLAMPGAVPDLAALPSGCAFRPRCALGRNRDECRTRPSLETRSGRNVACFFSDEVEEILHVPETIQPTETARAEPDPVLIVNRLSKHFAVRRRLFHPHSGTIKAVNRVSFEIARGETFALVGESGSGKTTVARLLLGLESPTAGTVHFRGLNVHTANAAQLRAVRRHVQVVFQSPDASLDPKMRVGDIVAEPLVAHGIGSRKENLRRAQDLLERVGLQADDVDRYPGEFSGGQKQRIAIARALVVDPELIICDEPVTALDVSVQATVLNLLYELQRERGMSYLLIAHDLSVVRQMADTVAVMYLGRIVEQGSAERFFERPAHPFSIALLSTLGGTNPTMERARRKITLSGTVPSPVDPPTGCAFHTRCWKAQEVCRAVGPELALLKADHEAACHFPQLSSDGGVDARFSLP